MTKATIRSVASSIFVMLFMLSFASTANAQNTMYGDNVVVDGDFAGDTLSSVWTVEVSGTATADVGVTNGELSFTNIATPGNPWEVQAYQTLTEAQIAELGRGGTFELTFEAYTTADTSSFHVFLGHNGGDWERFWATPDEDVRVTDEKATYTLTANIDQTWPDMKFGFEVAKDTFDLFIDNIVLRKVDDNLLYDGEIVIGDDSLSAAWNPIGNGTQATYEADNGAVKIHDFRGIVNSYDVQFVQELDTAQVDSIYAGPYEMFFDAKTEAAEKQIQVYFGNNGTDGDWTNFAPTIVLNDTMKTYSLSLSATQNWTSMKVGFEVSGDESAVWFDNVILRRVRDVPPPAPNFALSTANGTVTITVTPVEGAAYYDVYFADSAFTDSDGAGLVGTIDPTEGLTLDHTTFAPHPTLVSTFDAHYGVVARKENGTTSAIIPSSIETSMGVRENMIVELPSTEANAVLGAVINNEMPDVATMASYFPEGYMPFEINQSNFQQAEGSGVDSDTDLSAKFWMGFENITGSDFIIIYAEFTDDVLVFAPSAGENPGGAAWNYDTFEMGIGAYAPASFINGSDHENFETGAEPDYQLRGGYFSDSTLFINGYTGAGNLFDQAVPNSQTIGEVSSTGYRLLTILSTVEFSGIQTDNVDFDFPTGSEVSTVPFNIAINDNDASARDNQLSWAPNSGTSSWWNTPAQWATVAMVGADAFVVINSNEEEIDAPLEFALEQNYPNPFNPSTNIEFSLASTSNVTLEVFNMLGQKVSTLLQNERMAAGNHSQAFRASNLASGMYVYRITAGNFVQTRKMMLIK